MCDTSQCPPLGLSCFICTAGVFTPAPQGCQGKKPLHMAPASGSALGLGVLLRCPAEVCTEQRWSSSRIQQSMLAAGISYSLYLNLQLALRTDLLWVPGSHLARVPGASRARERPRTLSCKPRWQRAGKVRRVNTDRVGGRPKPVASLGLGTVFCHPISQVEK